MKVIANMMARGTGSTLKRKNAYPILGKPMLWWSLTEARKADFIDEIFVWTEDEELAQITRDCGCKVIPRSKDQVFLHGGFSNPREWSSYINAYITSQCGTSGDVQVRLNCNYCLMTAEILERMYIRLMEDRMADSIVAVSRVDPHLYMENPKTGRLFPIWQCDGMDRQEYPDLFRASGIVLVHDRREVSHATTVRLYQEVAPEFLLDVDSLEDVRLAEYYLMQRLGGAITLSEDAYERQAQRPGGGGKVQPLRARG